MPLNQEVERMITLSLKDSGALLGTIDEDDFDVLAGQLVVESEDDTDYYIDSATIDLLQRAGASARLVDLLRAALGDAEGVDIVWQEA
jgi:hypothetical protein